MTTPDYADFRRRLDAVLRRRDPAALREFLIAEGQWEPGTTTDVERAMWMMIATSPALGALRDEALRWLADHGHAEEARALGGGGRDGDGGARRGRVGGTGGGGSRTGKPGQGGGPSRPDRRGGDARPPGRPRP